MGVGIKDAIAATILVIGMAGAQTRADAVKISGRVEDRLPEPLANTPVLLRGAASLDEVSKTQTDNSGRFEFTGLQPNAYEVIFQVPGFKSLTVPVNATRNDGDVGTVVLDVAVFGDPIPVLIADSGALPYVHTPDPNMTTLCELLKSPLQFNGKIVQVHAHVNAHVNAPGIDSGRFFVDKTCSAWVGVGTSLEPLERTYLNYLFERYIGRQEASMSHLWEDSNCN